MTGHDNVNDRRLWKEELVPMPAPRTAPHVSPGTLPQIRTISLDQPLQWLHRGWKDLRENPILGIGFGFIIMATYGTAIGLAIYLQLYHLALQLTAGFALMAPVMALGFYEISRRNEQGRITRLGDVLTAWNINTDGVLGIGVIMVLLFLAWLMLSMQAAAVLVRGVDELALFTGGQHQTLPEFARALVAGLSIPTTLAYVMIGFVAVAVAFAFTAVSIPLLLDRPETDAITALVTSWKAVTTNWKPMLLWALIIAFITGVGLAFFFVGVALTTPLLGFASWHAYRDTLSEWREIQQPKIEYY